MRFSALFFAVAALLACAASVSASTDGSILAARRKPASCVSITDSVDCASTCQKGSCKYTTHPEKLSGKCGIGWKDNWQECAGGYCKDAKCVEEFH